MIKERVKNFFDVTWRSLLCGVIVGIIITFFVLGAEEIMSLVKEIFELSHGSWFLCLWLFVTLILITLLINLIFSYMPTIDGNCTAEKLKKRNILVRATDFGWLKTGLAYFLSTYLTFFAGLPFGAERPSAFLGITLSQGISRYTGGKQEDPMRVFGESAAVSVAVRGPITGCIYAIEEHLKKTKGKGMRFSLAFGAILSALTAYLIGFLFIKVIFKLHFSSFETFSFPAISMKYVLYLILLGVVIGVGAGLFFILSKLGQYVFGKADIRPFFLIVTAVLLTGIMGIIDIGDYHGYTLLGGGTNIIVGAANGEYSAQILGIYFAVKFVVILVCICSGANGGVFIPSMALGALLGGLMNKVFVLWGMPSEYLPSVILIAAAAFMGCFMHLPLTSLFLAIELAGFNLFSDGYSFGFIFAVLIVTITSYGISMICEIRSISLIRRINKRVKKHR